MRIRTFEEPDRAEVIDLWHRTGLIRPWNDPDRDIDRKLADSPWGLLVGVRDDGAGPAPGVGTAAPTAAADPPGTAAPTAPESRERIVATIMVGYDGHRGSVFYLAVDPEHQGRGVGSALMAHAEALLLARGCPKLSISVRAGNLGVIGFYERRGYRLEDASYAVTLGLRLIHDDVAG